MSSFISWVKKYPMTMLLIICCLIGGPYFGGQRVIEAYENYMGKAKGADVLEEWTQKAMKQQTLMKADAQGTKEQQVAQKGGPFVDVDQSYLDDAVFIGDSRTVGLHDYTDLSEHADFLCKTSLTIYKVLEENFKGMGTVEEVLKKKQYGKIYIMVGINELGRGTTEDFMAKYTEVVDTLHEWDPDARIIIQGIMKVSGKKDAEDKVFNNSNITGRNHAIATLADNYHIFYIDMNEAVCDEEGNLNAEYTHDQIHLLGMYNDLWKDFLMTKGISG